mgnify:CR=1 FL=1
MSKGAIYINALEERRQDRRWRRLRQAYPGALGERVLDGIPLINFASNDYLGLSKNPFVKQRAIQFIEKYGVGSTASRLMSGNLDVYERIEKTLAEMKGTEAALILPTGFQTNMTVLPALVGGNALIACDRLSHNSLLQGVVAAKARWFRYSHNDTNRLASELEARGNAAFDNVWLVTESVFGMDGDEAPLDSLRELACRVDATIYLDEAHATGVLGEHGMGYAGGDKRCVSMGTFGKGLGGFGAYIACSAVLKDYLINFAAGLIYSTALPPAVLGAIEAALELVPSFVNERRILAEHGEYLRSGLAKAGFNTGKSSTHIIPVLVGSDEAAVNLAAYLEQCGIFAPAIRPPTVPHNEARIRISLTIEHTRTQLDYLIKSLKGWHERNH